MMERIGSLAGKCGIYKFTFSNGHYYIGQAVNCRRRELQHIREMRNHRHTNSRVQNCYNKYGNPTFEIICECTKEELNSIETKYLFEHVDNELCCNLCKEANSRKGTTQDKKARKKISDYQRLIGKVKPVYMYTRDEMFLVARYDTITDATKAIGCGAKDIQKACKSNGKYSVKQYKFRFAVPTDMFLNNIKKIIPL